MKEETIIQILNSLTTVGEKSLDDLIEYYGHHMFNDLIAMVFFEIFIFYLFYKLFLKHRYKDDILFIIILISVILGILSIGMVCYFITGVSEYLAYLQNPLGATLNYLITGR